MQNSAAYVLGDATDRRVGAPESRQSTIPKAGPHNVHRFRRRGVTRNAGCGIVIQVMPPGRLPAAGKRDTARHFGVIQRTVPPLMWDTRDRRLAVSSTPRSHSAYFEVQSLWGLSTVTSTRSARMAAITSRQYPRNWYTVTVVVMLGPPWTPSMSTAMMPLAAAKKASRI
jgi:hypothetical protein